MDMRLLLVILGAAALIHAGPPSTVAIRNARVVTVSGPTLAKGTVLIQDGVIADVGENITIPPDAWIIEGQGLVVYPGLIDALNSWGIAGAAPETTATTAGRRGGAPATPPATPATQGRTASTSAEPVVHGPEERPATNSWLRAADLVSNTERRILEGRNAGYTSAVSYPTSGIFGGQGAFINLTADKRAMIVASPVGQYITMATAGQAAYPNSLMGTIAYIRQLYLDAEHYKLERSAYEAHKIARRPVYDRAVEGVLESPRTLLPASRAVELERMARFATEMKLPAVIYGAHEAYRDAESLRKYPYPYLVSLRWPERPRDGDPDAREPLRTLELRERAPSSPAVLAKSGLRFAFYSDGLSARDAVRAVKRAIDAGLPATEALRAITLGAAEIYGLGDRTGSIAKGKIANLLVTNGELFQEKTQVKYIFIDGVKYDPGPDTPAERSGPGERPVAGEPPEIVPFGDAATFGGVR
jgi:imidazolonepropionase-like amidohydrolase